MIVEKKINFWEYNELNKPSRYTDKQGRSTFYTYDKMWNLHTVTDPEGGVVTYTYNEANLLESVTDPVGRTVSFSYDVNGNRTGVHYPDGSSLRYEYDALNRRIKEVDQTGRESRMHYDKEGRITALEDATGKKICYTYDQAGRKLTETDRTGALTRYTYTALGKKESITYPDGRIEHYTYGPGGQLLKLSYGDGREESYTYDQGGNLLSVTHETGFTVAYTYDCLNRVTAICHGGELFKSYRYDALGNVTSMTDALGYTTHYAYSPMGKLTGVTDALGNRVHYAYNGRDELVGILQLEEGEKLAFLHPEETKGSFLDEDWEKIRAHNQENKSLHLTWFDRGLDGRITTITDALGQEVHYTYDLLGRAKVCLDSSGEETRWTYHPDGQVAQIRYPEGKEAAFFYDELARLRVVRDWLGETRFTYDGEGRIFTTTDHEKETVSYGYTPAGKRKWMVYPDGRKVEYGYDAIGRLKGIVSGAFRLEYAYDSWGRLACCKRGNGVDTHYEYDGAGRLTALTHEDQEGILEAFFCRYDGLGNKTFIRRESRQEGYGYARSYGYDGVSRLSEVWEEGRLLTTYGYDGYHNRTEVCSFPKTGEGKRPKHYAYDLLNRLREEGIVRGTYDGQKQLSSLSIRGEQIQTMRTNALGCRVGSNGMGYGLDYAEPYPRILTEKGSGGSTRSYLWQGNQLLGLPAEEGYVLTDFFSTPIALTDKAGGVLNTYQYREYGELIHKKERLRLPFGYSGYLRESIENLYYAGARTYHAGEGRFTTRDNYRYIEPINPLSVNLYQYAQNNPLRYQDFDGHESIEPQDYVKKSIKMVLLGNFTDEFTALGVGINIFLGIVGIDFIGDFRDLAADFTVNFDPADVWWWLGTLCDAIALFPIIGVLKYADDVLKCVVDVAGKYADEFFQTTAATLIPLLSDLLHKNGEEILHAVKNIKKVAVNIATKGIDLSKEAGRAIKEEVKNFLHALDELIESGGTKLKNGLKELTERLDKKIKEILGEGGTSTVQKVFTDSPFDEAGNLKPNIRYQTGEFKYNYETDANGRISNWNTDNLQLTERDGRLNYNPDSPGKVEGDHAGHLAGDRFGGSPELDNIVSQSQNVNLSQYKKIENQWAKAIGEGKEVTVNVDIKYDGDGLRPVEFNVEYTIDGDFFSQSILN